MTLDTAPVRKDPTAVAQSGYERKLQEQAQIEFLARQMGLIRDSLESIRDNWSTTDRDGDGKKGMAASRSRAIAKDLRSIYQAINDIFDGPDDEGEAGSWLVRARERLQSALEKAVKDDERDLADDFGLDLDFEDIEGAFLPDSRRIERGVGTLLRRRAGRLEEFLLGNRSRRQGLIGMLETSLDSVMKNLESVAGSRGISIDRYA